MPDTPDFEQLARGVVKHATIDGTIANDAWKEWLTGEIAEQLRLVWNARGAADRAPAGRRR